MAMQQPCGASRPQEAWVLNTTRTSGHTVAHGNVKGGNYLCRNAGGIMLQDMMFGRRLCSFADGQGFVKFSQA